MTINSINGASTQMRAIGMNQTEDSYSRNIQNQIANAQKQLQELSSNEDMALEEKMKKRQEIQQQISDLNMQLRQHQIEQRKAAREDSDKQQVQGSSMEDMPAGDKSIGFSQAGMTAMISAGTCIKQAKVQGSVAAKMQGRAGVLQSEIKLDQARGGDTRKKEEELAAVEQKAQAAASSQLSVLADASRTMKESVKADSKKEKSDADKDAKITNANGEVADKNTKDADEQSDASQGTAADETTPRKQTYYIPVNIRL